MNMRDTTIKELAELLYEEAYHCTRRWVLALDAEHETWIEAAKHVQQLLDDAHADGYDTSTQEAYDEGYDIGFTEGYIDGLRDCHDEV